MRNKLLLKLSWLGTHYNGWQRHCDEPIPSVYTVLHAALHAVTGHPVGAFARLIATCERRWNRPGYGDVARRVLGTATVALLIAFAALGALTCTRSQPSSPSEFCETRGASDAAMSFSDVRRPPARITAGPFGSSRKAASASGVSSKKPSSPLLAASTRAAPYRSASHASAEEGGAGLSGAAAVAVAVVLGALLFALRRRRLLAAVWLGLPPSTRSRPARGLLVRKPFYAWLLTSLEGPG